MIKVKVTEEQYEETKKLLNKKSVGNRGIIDGSSEQQFYGMMSQIVIAEIFGYEKPKIDGKWDGGKDYVIDGKNVDLKTMLRTVEVKENYVHNFWKIQENYECDFYLFASINKETDILTICGIVGKEQLKEFAKLRKKGEKIHSIRKDVDFELKGDMYEIKQTDLWQIDYEEDIHTYIKIINDRNEKIIKYIEKYSKEERSDRKKIEFFYKMFEEKIKNDKESEDLLRRYVEMHDMVGKTRADMFIDMINDIEWIKHIREKKEEIKNRKRQMDIDKINEICDRVAKTNKEEAEIMRKEMLATV